MGHLIRSLHGLRKIEKDNDTHDWVYYLIGALIALLVVIAVVIYYKKGKYLRQLCSAKRRGKFLTPAAPLVYQAVPNKFRDGTHIWRDASSPQQVLKQKDNDDPVSKPLVYPMIELVHDNTALSTKALDTKCTS